MSASVNVIEPQAFGAVGDGLVDDTDALQRALAASRPGLPLALGGRTYAVRGLSLGPGQAGIQGPGALRGLSDAPVLAVAGASDAPADGIRLEGLDILAGPARAGIHVAHAAHTAICDCRIHDLRDMSRGIIIHHGAPHTVVRNCRIEAPLANLQSLVGIYVESPTAPGPAGFFEPPAGEVKYREETTFGCVMEGNSIDGGTHGILLCSAGRNRIAANTIARSLHRNINICPASRHNVILGNTLLESGSSAVAMAYGSSFNVVANNAILSRSTAVGVDRDAIHSYVSCRHNVIAGNTITGDFRYGVYLAVDSVGTLVDGNQIALARKPELADDFTVGVGLEGDWPERPLPEGARFSRRNFGSARPNAWAYRDTVGNVVRGNVVEACTCGFYASQFGARLRVTGNRWEGNTALDAEVGLYAYGETEGLFRDNLVSGLLTPGTPRPLVLPPWQGSPFHFA